MLTLDRGPPTKCEKPLFHGAPEEIRTPDPQIRSLMLKKPTKGRRRIDIRNALALAGHPNPGTSVDTITSCLRSKIETNFVPTASLAMGIADTDVQLCWHLPLVWKAQGLAGLRSRKQLGPFPKLTAQREAELAALVEAGPRQPLAAVFERASARHQKTGRHLVDQRHF